jgi:hypothetical protein
MPQVREGVNKSRRKESSGQLHRSDITQNRAVAISIYRKWKAALLSKGAEFTSQIYRQAADWVITPNMRTAPIRSRIALMRLAFVE